MQTPVEHASSRREFLRRLTLGAALLSTADLTRLVATVATPPRKLGVALLGLGYYSNGELGPALRQTKLCQLSGVISGSPEKAARWAKDYNLSPKNLYNYETMDRLADNPDIDIVYVVTPNALHAEHTIRAARAGKHVICEKPMATSVADCEAMIAACRQAGRKLSIGYRMHFDPTFRELERLAREQDFGPLLEMKGEFGFFNRFHAWRLVRKLSGGGPLMDLGIYIIQEACAAAGATPVAVTAKALPVTRPDFFSEVEETLQFALEFPNGAKCDCQTSYTERYNHFRAAGAKGWIEIENAYGYHGQQATTSRGSFPFTPVNQQALQMDAFAACVLENRESIVPGEMGLRDMRIITAIYDAMRSGGRVTV